MKHIELKALGFNHKFLAYRQENNLSAFLTGRVILEHRERYIVLTEQGKFECELLGNLRYAAGSRRDLPAVGDWVALREYDTGKGLIQAVYPRFSLLERQAVGKAGEKQIIASNIDYGLIVQSLNRDFSVNRIERYLTICSAGNIQPVILLSKIDLVDHQLVQDTLQQIKARVSHISIFAISNTTGEGLEDLKTIFKTGKTYCLLGSSGVGKSTLINSFSGHDIMQTGEISQHIDRGKHVTTHRELILLDTGGILIDNPGMREVGIADSSAGLEATFEQIYKLAAQCKFNDCTHVNEKGCAIVEALDNGQLNEQAYENYIKLEKEQAHYSLTVHEKRKKDKRFGKMVKSVMQQKKRDKY